MSISKIAKYFINNNALLPIAIVNAHLNGEDGILTSIDTSKHRLTLLSSIVIYLILLIVHHSFTFGATNIAELAQYMNMNK